MDEGLTAPDIAPCTFPFSTPTLGLFYCLMFNIDPDEVPC